MNLLNYEITMYLLWEMFKFFHDFALNLTEILRNCEILDYIYMYIQIVNFGENLKINTSICLAMID